MSCEGDQRFRVGEIVSYRMNPRESFNFKVHRDAEYKSPVKHSKVGWDAMECERAVVDVAKGRPQLLDATQNRTL